MLGVDTLVEDILVRLLKDAGYAARLLEAYPMGLGDELLDGMDVVLVAPKLKDTEVRGAFLRTIRSTPKTAHQPVLSLSSALMEALLDEPVASAPGEASWGSWYTR